MPVKRTIVFVLQVLEFLSIDSYIGFRFLKGRVDKLRRWVGKVISPWIDKSTRTCWTLGRRAALSDSSPFCRMRRSNWSRATLEKLALTLCHCLSESRDMRGISSRDSSIIAEKGEREHDTWTPCDRVSQPRLFSVIAPPRAVPSVVLKICHIF